MSYRFVYSTCLLVTKQRICELVGTAEGTESVVGIRVVVVGIDVGEVVVNDVKRLAFTARNLVD